MTVTTSGLVERELSRLDQLIDVIVSKGREACYVDLIAGTVLLFVYGVQLWNHQTVDLWPLISALAVTRGGDAAKGIAQAIGGRRGNEVQQVQR